MIGCQYDNGDCMQLCDFTQCPLELIGDGNCDTQCNNTLCQFDGGDCQNTTYCNPDETDPWKQCHTAWIGDGW